ALQVNREPGIAVDPIRMSVDPMFGPRPRALPLAKPAPSPKGAWVEPDIVRPRQHVLDLEAQSHTWRGLAWWRQRDGAAWIGRIDKGRSNRPVDHRVSVVHEQREHTLGRQVRAAAPVRARELGKVELTNERRRRVPAGRPTRPGRYERSAS